MFRRWLAVLGMVALMCGAAGSVQATPFTSDFNSSSWQVEDGTFTVISADIARLTTSASQTPATLYQDFDTVQPLSLSFWLKWTPTSIGDFISVDLADAATGTSVLLNSPLLDPADPLLLTGRRYTLLLDPAFAGDTLDLNFTLTDVDGDADMLEVSFASAPVPEPSTFFLLSLGAVGLGLARIRKKK